MTRTSSLLLLGALVALAIAVPFATVFGQSGDGPSNDVEKAELALSTVFTYQGRLTDDGDLADGPYDMRFILYDAAAGGAQVGATAIMEDVPVSDGFFTVGLDFGAASFNGDARWLEIAIKLPAQATYTVLNPRQPLTAVPYALYALNGSGGGLTLPASASANSASPTPGLSISQTGGGGGMVLSRAPATPTAGYALDVANTGDGAAIRAVGAGTSAALDLDGALKVSGAAPAAFVHTVEDGAPGPADNRCESNAATVITNALIDGDPDAILLVTYRGTGNSLSQPATAFGVMYDSGSLATCTDNRWVVYSLDPAVDLAAGMEFNVLVIQR